ncbi:hypothetical protein L195_g014573 [Trifolium pratense]|uniref:Uncharacterized protein n=1 Tax=Trifolium pratense TaxID=57577 RepID=A0A2K3PRD0_TRIPR|nr:hypothetical protein L195_g014573 [Trifolium pratense]
MSVMSLETVAEKKKTVTMKSHGERGVERMVIGEQKAVVDEKESRHQILCNGSYSLKITANLVPLPKSSGWKLNERTTGITIAGEAAMQELPLKVCSLVVVPAPPPKIKPPDANSWVVAPAVQPPPKPTDYNIGMAGALRSKQWRSKIHSLFIVIAMDSF